MTRITVLDVKRRVIDGDEDPFAVATEYDLDLAAVFQALAIASAFGLTAILDGVVRNPPTSER